MKIKLIYCTKHQEEIEISPEEYCELHASSDYGDYFPKDSFARKVELGAKAIEELNEYFYRNDK